MGELIIIGVGNPLRGDDGAGWAVVDSLKKNLPPSIPLRKVKGDIADLMEAFASYPIVYLIDACSLEAPPGSWRRIDGIHDSLPVESHQTSTHGFGLSQAIGLAKNLNLLPAKLILYVIAGNEYHLTDTLSPQVAAAIGQVAMEILNEEDIHARKEFNG